MHCSIIGLKLEKELKTSLTKCIYVRLKLKSKSNNKLKNNILPNDFNVIFYGEIKIRNAAEKPTLKML